MTQLEVIFLSAFEFVAEVFARVLALALNNWVCCAFGNVLLSR